MMAEVLFRDCLNDGWSLIIVHGDCLQWWQWSGKTSVIVSMMAEVLQFRHCLNDGWVLPSFNLNDGWSLVPWLSQWWLTEHDFRDCLNDGKSACSVSLNHWRQSGDFSHHSMMAEVFSSVIVSMMAEVFSSMIVSMMDEVLFRDCLNDARLKPSWWLNHRDCLNGNHGFSMKSCSVIVSMMAEVMFRDCLNDGWSLVPWLSQWWLKSCSVIVSMMNWSLVPWLSQWWLKSWWLKSCSVIVSMMAEVMFRDCLNDGWSHVPWLSQWWLKSCSVIVSMMAEVLFRDWDNDGWSLQFRDCLNDGWLQPSLSNHVPWLPSMMAEWWLKSSVPSLINHWNALSQWWLNACSVIVSMMARLQPSWAEVLFRDCLNDGWSLVPWSSQWWLKSCSVIVSMMAEV